MQHKTRDQHLFDPGPKRILALDGGGIRGILSLQILKKIENILRVRAGGDESFRLCDYFDLIGGTSTGAIIAAALALGYSVDQIEALYRRLGGEVFAGEWLRLGVLRPKFSAEPLRRVLEEEFGDLRLGDDKVRTGLAIMVKRMDTGSPWVLHNNPRGRYFAPRPGSTTLPNSQYLLRDIVRASTAAPHYFEPECIQIAEARDGKRPVEGAFVDGGVSPYNNPALQLLLLASLEGYGLQWPLGADRILLASVGTGWADLAMDAKAVIGMADIKLAMRALGSLMDDALALNELLLQWLSTSPTARPIDREVGDLRNDVLGNGQPWLTYLRYNAALTADWLTKHAHLRLSDKEIETLRKMDEPDNIETLVKVGQAAAEQVEERHLPAQFDLPVQ